MIAPANDQPIIAVARRNQKLGPQYVGISESFEAFSSETLTSILYDSLSTQSVRVIMRHHDEAGAEYVVQSEKVSIRGPPGNASSVVYSLIHAIRCAPRAGMVGSRPADLGAYKQVLAAVVKGDRPIAEFLEGFGSSCSKCPPVAVART